MSAVASASAVSPRALHIVLNTGSGASAGPGAGDDARAAIDEALGAGGTPYDVLTASGTDGILDATRQAIDKARASGGAVVAAGGDGTIGTVAQAVLPTGLAFGVLPRGTFNFFARAHGVPLETSEAARALVSAHVRPVQVGLLNGRVFLVNASLGLYPTLLEDREAWKRQFGRSRLVALGAALATLLQRHRRLDLHVRVDGGGERLLRTTTLFVGNNRLQLESIGIAESERADRGELVFVAVKPVGSLAMLWLAIRGALGTLGDADDAISFAAPSLEVTAARRRGGWAMKAATDGEVCRLDAPLVFEVARERLQLLVPVSP